MDNTTKARSEELTIPQIVESLKDLTSIAANVRGGNTILADKITLSSEPEVEGDGEERKSGYLYELAYGIMDIKIMFECIRFDSRRIAKIHGIDDPFDFDIQKLDGNHD